MLSEYSKCHFFNLKGKFHFIICYKMLLLNVLSTFWNISEIKWFHKQCINNILCHENINKDQILRTNMLLTLLEEHLFISSPGTAVFFVMRLFCLPLLKLQSFDKKPKHSNIILRHITEIYTKKINVILTLKTVKMLQ